MGKLLVVLLCVGLLGCATSSKINLISLGMSKEDVIKRMGNPISTSAIKGKEFMNYLLTDPIYGMPASYYVSIQDGKVVSYGEKGDFGTTQEVTKVIELTQNIKTDDKVKGEHMSDIELATKIKTLNKLLTDKLITQNEFDEQKKKLLNEYTSK